MLPVIPPPPDPVLYEVHVLACTLPDGRAGVCLDDDSFRHLVANMRLLKGDIRELKRAPCFTMPPASEPSDPLHKAPAPPEPPFDHQ